MASSALRGVAKRVVALTTRQQGVLLRHSGVMASTAPMLARAHSSSSSGGGDATMKAIVVTEWVNPEAIGDSLVPTTVPAPDIDDGCVKVAVAAAGASECGVCVTGAVQSMLYDLLALPPRRLFRHSDDGRQVPNQATTPIRSRYTQTPKHTPSII